MRIKNHLFRHAALLTVLSLFLSGCVTGSMAKHYSGPEGYDYSQEGQGRIFMDKEALSPAICVRSQDMEPDTCLMIKDYSKSGWQLHSILSGQSGLDIRKVEVKFYPDGEDLMAYMKASYARENIGSSGISFDPKGEVVDLYAGPFRTEPFDMEEAELVEAGPHGFKVNVGIAEKAEQSGKATAKALATAPMTLFVDGVIVVASFFLFILFIMGGGA